MTSTAGPQPAAVSRSSSGATAAPARQSGVKENSVVPRSVMPSEHRVVVGGGGGPRLKDVPVLDDAVTLGAVDVDHGGRGSTVPARPEVERADVAVHEHPLDREREGGVGELPGESVTGRVPAVRETGV